MNLDTLLLQPLPGTPPLYIGGLVGLLLAYVAFTKLSPPVRRFFDRTSIEVVGGFFAACVLTAYSADASWRYARDDLGITDDTERWMLFAAAEIAMLALVFLARKNLRGKNATPGTPGILIKVVTCVQVIPSYSISDTIADGSMRAFFGPILAMMMWHIVLGVDLRHSKEGEEGETREVQTWWAQVTRSVRERTSARLGLARPDMNALEITQERHLDKAVDWKVKLLAAQHGTGKIDKYRTRRSRGKVSKFTRVGVGDSPERQDEFLRRVAILCQVFEIQPHNLPRQWDAAIRRTNGKIYPEAFALTDTLRTGNQEALERSVRPVPRAPAPVERPDTPSALPALLERLKSDPEKVAQAIAEGIPGAPTVPGETLFADGPLSMPAAVGPSPKAEEPPPAPPVDEATGTVKPQAQQPGPPISLKKAVPEPVASPAPAPEPDPEPDPEPPSPTPKAEVPKPVEKPKPKAPVPGTIPAPRKKPKEAVPAGMTPAKQKQAEGRQRYISGEFDNATDLGEEFGYGRRWGELRIAEVKAEQKAAEEAASQRPALHAVRND